MRSSETFSVNNWGTSFLIFLFGDPHSLEGWKGAKNWATNPDQEFSFSWGDNLDFHGWRSQSSHFFAETFRNTREHSSSTTHNDVAIKIFADINIALENWLIGDFMESWHFLSDNHGLEKGFRASEPLGTNDNGLSVREFVAFVILSWGVIS